MVMSRPSVSAVHPPHQGRIVVLWIGFGIATIVAALAVQHLYATVSRELAEQSRRALGEERGRAQAEVEAEAGALRHRMIAKLAALHVDGLEHSLRAWADGESQVVAAFVATPGGEFHLVSRRAAVPAPEEIVALAGELRRWRAAHPTARQGAEDFGPYRAEFVRTVENPDFAAGELGYQGENLSLMSDSGATVDPWAGWAGKRAQPVPWVIWYQTGPTAPIRGCLVDVGPVAARLRTDLRRSRVARLDLVPVGLAAGAAGESVNLEHSLPGYALLADEGVLFSEKQASVRFAAAAVVLLIGVFLLGAAFLVAYSRREMADARRKATFVTQVSHELRTPLTSIEMFADLLAAPAVSDEKRAQFAGRIGRESRRLAQLIERLLTFSALEKGKALPLIEPVDVIEAVRETLEESADRLSAAGLALESKLPAEAVVVPTDRSTLKQALLNLLDNAQKYAAGGGWVGVSVERTNEDVRIRVTDAGPGIPGALGERVFEPFVQGNQTLTDKVPGVGLGLSIARGLLRNAGGDLLLLASKKGAVFEIRLPFVPPP